MYLSRNLQRICLVSMLCAPYWLQASDGEWRDILKGMSGGRNVFGAGGGRTILTINGQRMEMDEYGNLTTTGENSLDTYKVDVILPEGRLSYSISDRSLVTHHLPSSSWINSGNGSMIGGGCSILGSDCSRYSIKLRSGKILNLLEFAKEQDLVKRNLEQYKMDWDTSEEGFAKHISILAKGEIEPKDKLILLTLWEGEQKLSRGQFIQILEQFPEEDRFKVGTKLAQRLADFDEITDDEILTLVQGDARRNAVTQEFLIAIDKMSSRIPNNMSVSLELF